MKYLEKELMRLQEEYDNILKTKKDLDSEIQDAGLKIEDGKISLPENEVYVLETFFSGKSLCEHEGIHRTRKVVVMLSKKEVDLFLELAKHEEQGEEPLKEATVCILRELSKQDSTRYGDDILELNYSKINIHTIRHIDVGLGIDYEEQSFDVPHIIDISLSAENNDDSWYGYVSVYKVKESEYRKLKKTEVYLETSKRLTRQW